MTAFDCKVTNVNALATAIAKPKVSLGLERANRRCSRLALAFPLLQDPIYCAPGDTSCTPTAGAKRPLYAYK